MTSAARLLVVARAGPLADGLLGFLGTVPGVQVIGRVDEVTASVTTISDLAPSVVVLAFGRSTKQNLAALVKLQAMLSEGRSVVVLANDVQQQRAAEKCGADAVLLKGCRPAELVAAIYALTPLS